MFPWRESGDDYPGIPPGYEPYDCGRPGCLVMHYPVPKEPSHPCDALTCRVSPESPDPVNIPMDLDVTH